MPNVKAGDLAVVISVPWAPQQSDAPGSMVRVIAPADDDYEVGLWWFYEPLSPTAERYFKSGYTTVADEALRPIRPDEQREHIDACRPVDETCEI